MYIYLRSHKESHIWEARRQLLPPKSRTHTGGHAERKELCTNAKRKTVKVQTVSKVMRRTARIQNAIDEEMFEKCRTAEGWRPDSPKRKRSTGGTDENDTVEDEEDEDEATPRGM